MTLSFARVALSAALLVSPVLGHATTLTFDLIPIGNGVPVGNYGDNVVDAVTDAQGTGAAAAGSYIIGSEGATPNVTVSYQGPDPSVWTSGYSGLTNVFYEEVDGTL